MGKANKVSFLIVGGGIGGLAAALGAAEVGHDVTVLEQAPEFGEIGAGIQLAPNATAVLDRFGVLDNILKTAVLPKRLVLMDAYTAKELSTLDLGKAFQEHYGYPYIVLHRSDLHKGLYEACMANPRITLLTNQQVDTIVDGDDHTTVTCKDGTTYVADAVVGADGLWSKARQLFSSDKLVCAEYVAYRGTIPISEIPSSFRLDDVIMWIGPYIHFVQYPIRRKELFNQVCVFKSFNYREDSDDWGTPEELDEHYSKFCDVLRHAATFMNRDRRWPMYDREPIDNWTKGRITLLGDAAHPMLQYIAQGGCQALEDAACLTKHLHASGSNIEKAFLDYQTERIPHTARVQRTVRTYGEAIHAADPTTVLLRNMILENRSPEDFKHVDWLYNNRHTPILK